MTKHLVILCAISCSVLLHAEPLKTTNDDRRLQDEQIQGLSLEADLNTPSFVPSLPTNAERDTTLTLDESQLLQHPQLLSNALMAALLYNQDDDVVYLLSLYKKLDPKYIDEDILLWSQAVQAHAQQDYKLAVQHYQTIINRYPDNHIIGLRLAIALFLLIRIGQGH